MRKFLAMLLVLAMAMAFVGCGTTEPEATEPQATEPQATEPQATEPEAPVFDPLQKSEGTMTYAEYAAADLDSPVTVECFVQGNQSWWDNKITVYAQDPDGAYFMYEMACSEEDAAKLTKGTKIKVTGYKAEWSGELEIVDCTFEILEGNWVAPAQDVTALLGTEELINHQNQFVSFKGLTVEAVEYKNGEPGDDIYVTFGYNGASYEFCVERYLTDPETEVYAAVGALKAGDVVNVEGFLYWYNGANTHITSVTPAA